MATTWKAAGFLFSEVQIIVSAECKDGITGKWYKMIWPQVHFKH